MRINGKELLTKHKLKNQGNKRLVDAINGLIADLESDSADEAEKLLATRRDADRVHPKGFYFFDLHIHRTLVLLEFAEKEATILWIGAHDEYSVTFKNNLNTIEKWLRIRNWID